MVYRLHAGELHFNAPYDLYRNKFYKVKTCREEQKEIVSEFSVSSESVYIMIVGTVKHNELCWHNRDMATLQYV